jgi:hypothetical protein
MADGRSARHCIRPQQAWEELCKAAFVSIGVRQMDIALSPGAVLRWGRCEPLGKSRAVEGVDVVDAEDRPAPPGRRIAGGDGEIDKGLASLECTEPRLWPPVHQREAQLRVEGNRLWHGAHGKGHGANVLDHGRSSQAARAAHSKRLAACRQPPTGATISLHAVSRRLSQRLLVGQAVRP